MPAYQNTSRVESKIREYVHRSQKEKALDEPIFCGQITRLESLRIGYTEADVNREPAGIYTALTPFSHALDCRLPE
jgi:hypothetical protein